MNEIKLTRKELYDLVWSEPLAVIAKKFGTTDYGLRKICKEFIIPLPKSGHWMKIQFGKPVIIEKFVENFEGPTDVSLSKIPSEENSITIAIESSPLQLLTKEIENDRNVSLVVPERLLKPDKLIESAKKALAESYGYSSHGNRLHAWDQLKILVTKENIGRALRFMDTFIKAIRARGHDIKISNRDTFVIICEEEIKISCKEKAKRVIISNSPYNNTELRSTGILSFNIDGFYTKEWKDGKLKLEEQLSVILAKLELEGKRLKNEREERHRYWEEEDRKRKIVENIQKGKEKQLEEFKSLIKNSQKYRDVLMIREYIMAIEEKAKNSGNLTEELKNWIQWAQKKTNWYDPFLNHPDPELEGVDKETLTFIKSNLMF